MTCGTCGHKVYRQDDQLLCKGCSVTFHLKCTGQTIDNLLEMSKQGTTVNWKCGDCSEVNKCQLMEGSQTTTINTSTLSSPEKNLDDGDSDRSCGKEPNSLSSPADIVDDAGSLSEVYYLKQIITQKDEIIRCQMDLISSLKDQVALLKACSTTGIHLPPMNTASYVENTPSSQKSGNAPSPQREKLGDKRRKNVNLKNGNVTRKNSVAQMSKSELNLRSYEAATIEKCSELINLTKDSALQPNDIPPITGLSSESSAFADFSKGKSKQSRRQIVGIKAAGGVSNIGIRAAKTSRFFHVTKLDPETSIEGLLDYLQPSFPEVKVEKLNSKYPESYTSFKIMVFQENEDRIFDPSFWPAGCRVNRFFLRRGNRVPGQGGSTA